MNFKSLEDSETAISIPFNMFKQKELLVSIGEAFKHGGLNRLREIIDSKQRGKIPLDQSEDMVCRWN
jgi:hypothetical protein